MAPPRGRWRRFLAAAAYQWEGPEDLLGSLRLEWRFVRIRWLGIVCVAPGILLVHLPFNQLVGAYVVLLVAASLVAVVVQRVRIPYTVGLVIVGILLPSDALGLDTSTALSPSVVLPLLLPPLLFEAAFALRWDHLAPVANRRCLADCLERCTDVVAVVARTLP